MHIFGPFKGINIKTDNKDPHFSIFVCFLS